MNEQMVIFLLSFFVLMLAGIVVWQHLAFRSGIRRELLEMAEELKDILDRDSGAGLMIFTNHQGLMALMAQINRLLGKTPEGQGRILPLRDGVETDAVQYFP